MSNERSPREVCSTTIGTREVWTRPICIVLLSFARLQLSGCITIAQPFGCILEAWMEPTVERELTVPEDAEEVWRSLAEPEWLGEDAAIELREAGGGPARGRGGLGGEGDGPPGPGVLWGAPGRG